MWWHIVGFLFLWYVLSDTFYERHGWGVSLFATAVFYPPLYIICELIVATR